MKRGINFKMANTLFRVSSAVLCSHIGTQLTSKRPPPLGMGIIETKLTSTTAISLALLLSVDFYFQHLSGKPSVSNSLGTDQARRIVGPHLHCIPSYFSDLLGFRLSNLDFFLDFRHFDFDVDFSLYFLFKGNFKPQKQVFQAWCLGLIWVQTTICKGYQQMTLAGQIQG